ncbi:Spy/CpxP family protein refolding chaperone [Roseateles sp. BYS87W]|uniref:Spy/CpxP family protein refolding chaperone n=1 Tax=Pelomonas baiyunensis TaxID=3299026 RepID=A0ABW7GX37_9BURK
MNFLRRWHAHHEFRHHFGHGHHGHRGHPFGRHADAGGFADHLVDRAAAKLDLDDEQRRRLAAWVAQLQQQRQALKGLARGPELTGLLAGDQFPRESAQQLLDAKLDALRAAGPGVIGAFAEFFDALDAEQRQVLRFTMRRFGLARRRGDAA